MGLGTRHEVMTSQMTCPLQIFLVLVRIHSLRHGLECSPQTSPVFSPCGSNHPATIMANRVSGSSFHPPHPSHFGKPFWDHSLRGMVVQFELRNYIQLACGWGSPPATVLNLTSRDMQHLVHTPVLKPPI